MFYHFKFHWIFFPIPLIALLLLNGCSNDSGYGEDDSNWGWVKIEYSSVYNDSLGDAYANVGGTAFTNSSFAAHHCTGSCCLLCWYDDSYPGVDVAWENRTTATIGSAESRYGTLTRWDHIWSASIPLVLGSNEIIITASDPEGNYGQDKVVVNYLPPAPVILSVDTGDSQITLEWPNVSGADSYNIYWSADPDFTKENAAPIFNATSLYTHSGLVNGQTYYYAVTSVFNGIESALSEKVSAVAGTPHRPEGVSANASGADIVISWNESPTAASYNLFWSNEENVTLEKGNLIAGVTGPYTHTGLIGIPYYYIVTALNSYGTSYKSAEVTAMPELPPPTPQDLNGSVRSVFDPDFGFYVHAVDLNWSSVAGAQYVLYRCTGSGPYFPDPKSCFSVAAKQVYVGSENRYTDIDVVNGWAYLYRVSAENDFGISEHSETFGILVE